MIQSIASLAIAASIGVTAYHEVTKENQSPGAALFVLEYLQELHIELPYDMIKWIVDKIVSGEINNN